MSETVLDPACIPEGYVPTNVINHTESVLCVAAREVESSTAVFVKVKDGSLPTRNLRLAREAEVLSELSHEQIPRMLAADTDESQPFPYLVTELKPGNGYPVSWIKKYPAPTLAARLCLSGLEALGYIHDQGFVHRDITTKNLLMQFSGQAALVDFELSIHNTQKSAVNSSLNASDGIPSGHNDTRITQEGLVAGTADYISPERAMGEPGGQESDIYSMGIVLYELAFGKTPFYPGDPHQVAIMHCRQPIDFSDENGRGVPDELKIIIDRATQKQPRSRYRLAQDMGEELANYLSKAN